MPEEYCQYKQFIPLNILLLSSFSFLFLKAKMGRYWKLKQEMNWNILFNCCFVSI